ncbi:MAG: FtsX-like permease family protein [Pseudomonadota bacterium]
MGNQMNGKLGNGSAKPVQAAPVRGFGHRRARMVVLPWGKSMEIAIRSIRVRFFRSLITTLTLVLAISFFSYVRVNAVTARGMILAHDTQAMEWLQTRGYDSDDGSMDPGVNPRDRWILFLSLLVCVVGIVNTQLMAVTERFRDIGTMKCLGALDRFVLRLFLIEAAFQGLLGAALGAVLGAGISVLGTLITFGSRGMGFILWPGVFASLVTALALGCCLSLLGVLYPALLAARMRPVEAMRGKD